VRDTVRAEQGILTPVTEYEEGYFDEFFAKLER